jgi:hypothetical protein
LARLVAAPLWAQVQARDDTMRIGLVLLIVLALWPWRADARHASTTLASGTFCEVERELPWYHPRRAGQAACAWTADLRSAVSTVPGDWGYKAGATLFVVGNVVTFSFPLWAALGADVYTVTGVIIAGEAIEVVGIYVLGEEAFHDLKGTLRDMARQLGDQIDRLRSSAPAWS